MVVAIDGPAGAGKSSVARFVSQSLGFTYLNSGSLYRGIAALCIRSKLAHSEEEILKLSRQIQFSFKDDQLYNGFENIEGLLRTDTVDALVSEVAVFPELRISVNQILIEQSKNKNVVVEGRDMTTVVFPNAEIKFYLDAHSSTRALRRHAQGTSQLSILDIESSIKQRDSADQNREIGQLKIASDAEYIDTTGLTIQQVCARVVQSIQGYLLRQEKS